jgi:peptidoglycan/LPS O-acetylase OafA/YrhL
MSSLHQHQRSSSISNNTIHPPPVLEEIIEDDLLSEKSYRSSADHSVNDALLRLKSFLIGFLVTLIPSFLHRTPHGAPTKQLHPTAYLDGLRGVAAFIVFIHHTVIDWYPMLSRGYGSSEPENSLYFFQWPFVRLIYSGRGMVSVFFVISGYVLSYKAIRLMRAGQYPALLDSLASSTFRRGMRLFLPTIPSTFISLLFCRWDLYTQDPLRRNIIPPKQDTFWLQLKDWWKHVILMSNPLVDVNGRNLYATPYDGHLWTIPIEFHGSLIVFLTLLCIAKLRSRLRLLALSGFVFYSIWDSHWEVFLFLSGILFCDLHFLQASSSPSSAHTNPSLTDLWNDLPTIPKAHRQLALHALSITLALLATHLLCFPDELGEDSPGYRTLIEYTPRNSATSGLTQRFWLAIGAFLLVGAMNFSPLLQRPFTTAVAQYLGKISFALYIVHGPVLYTLGLKMMPAPYEGWADGEGWMGYALLAVGAWMLDLVVAVWAADVFWREVDARAVVFAGWVARKCWVEE